MANAIDRQIGQGVLENLGNHLVSCYTTKLQTTKWTNHARTQVPLFNSVRIFNWQLLMIPNLLVYHIVEFQDFSVAHILRELNFLFLAILGALGFVHYKIHSL